MADRRESPLSLAAPNARISGAGLVCLVSAGAAIFGAVAYLEGEAFGGWLALGGLVVCSIMLVLVRDALKERGRLRAQMQAAAMSSQEPPGEVAVSARSVPGVTHCSYCRESFDHRPVMLCPLCETRLHPECWTELGGCPTLGCMAGRPRDKKAQALKDNG